MAIEVHEGGGMSITGDGIRVYRLLTIWSGLKMETRGMRLSRGRSCLAIVRKEFGVKARTAVAALPIFEAMLREAGVLQDPAGVSP
jgi:hypothetical protein